MSKNFTSCTNIVGIAFVSAYQHHGVRWRKDDGELVNRAASSKAYFSCI